MNTELITVGPFEVNCTVVWGENKQALIIDPGCDAEAIEAVLQTNNLSVAAWLLTHGHADHINALNELHTAHPAPVYLHPADERWAFGPNNQIPPYYPVPTKPDTDFPTLGKDNLDFSKVWKIADLSFQCLETPGHTPGGVCYWFKEHGVCFVGDTLFRGSAGRTDLPGGDARTLTASLKMLAETLPPETRIISGHGEDTTMAHELATNFFLQRFSS
jgi:glyoxylase-like metal-dependent hydrolase (beta-lactamase superfamily II)